MLDSIFVALQVFMTGFVISLFIAVIIKVMLFIIRYFSKESAKE